MVAKTDEKWGETPCAFVSLKPGEQLTEEDVLNFCRENLARFKVPKHVVFTDLPKTSTGKVQKFALRALKNLMTKQATLGLTLTCLVIAALTLPVVNWLTAFCMGSGQPDHCLGGVRRLLRLRRGADVTWQFIDLGRGLSLWFGLWIRHRVLPAQWAQPAPSCWPFLPETGSPVS